MLLTLVFLNNFLNWSTVDLQHYASFKCMANWFIYTLCIWITIISYIHIHEPTYVPYLLITCHFYFSDCYFWHSYFTGCHFSSTFNGCLILGFPILLSTWDADGHNHEFISYVEKQIIWIVLTEKEKKKKHSLKVESYVLFDDLTEDCSLGFSLSDSSEKLLQRDKGGPRI